MGSGHTVTALYEIVPAGVPLELPGVDPLKYQKPAGEPTTAATSGEWLTAKMRYKHPESAESLELAKPLPGEATGQPASRDFAFAAAVAEFGMLLRDSPYKGQASWDRVLSAAEANVGADRGGHRQEFAGLVRKARELVKAAAEEPVAGRDSTSCCGRESGEPHPVRPALYGQPDPAEVPGQPAPGREGPLARDLAAGPDRRAPHPGRGRRSRRPLRRDRPGGPPPVERRRPGRGGGRPQGQRVRPEALDPAAGRPVRRAPGAAARRRAVDRAEGRPVRPGPVGRVGRPGDRVAVAAGPRVHPPGPPPQPPPGGRPAGPKAVGKNSPPGEATAGGEPGQAGGGVGGGRGEARAQAGHPPGVVAQGVPAPVGRADPVRVALRVRVRPAPDRGDVHADPAPGEGRADGGRPDGLCGLRRPGI